jgi:DNA polymerase-1
MTNIELVNQLRRNGSNLKLENGQLILAGRQITPGQLQQIRERKTELIDFLNQVKTCEYIREKEKLLRIEPFIMENKIRRIYIDTETTGLDPFDSDLCLIQIGTGINYYIIDVGAIGIGSELAPFYSGIRAIMEDAGILKVGHNLKFDLKFLAIHLFGESFGPKNLFDTYLAEQLLTAGVSEKGDNRLDVVVLKYTGEALPKDQQLSFKPGALLTQDQLKYALNDVEALVPVFNKQIVSLQEQGLIPTAKLEFGIIPAIMRIELAGMFMDERELAKLNSRLEGEKATSEKALNEMVTAAMPQAKQAGIFSEPSGGSVNFSSPKQVKELFKTIGISLESTDTATVGRINHPIARELVNYRKLNKRITSFAAKLPGHVSPWTNRIHPDFHQLGAATGRFTCSNPNLQQLPRGQEWRSLFIAGSGNKIITADYSQIELRILAEFSQDAVFLEAFRSGLDLHRQTASQVFNTAFESVTKEQRNAAKAINFGLVYGMTATGLALRLNIPEQEAEGFIIRYFRAYPSIKDCLQTMGMSAVNKGYSITPLGRKRFYKPIDGFSGQKSRERQGRNTPIQATCGDILKTAILYIYPALPEYGANIMNLVHDELVIEVREDHAEALQGLVKDRMTQAGCQFIKSVPVEVDITVNSMWKK